MQVHPILFSKTTISANQLSESTRAKSMSLARIKGKEESLDLNGFANRKRNASHLEEFSGCFIQLAAVCSERVREKQKSPTSLFHATERPKVGPGLIAYCRKA